MWLGTGWGGGGVAWGWASAQPAPLRTCCSSAGTGSTGGGAPGGAGPTPHAPPIPQAVRLESARPRRVRYLLVVRPEEEGAEEQTALLGVDFAHEE